MCEEEAVNVEREIYFDSYRKSWWNLVKFYWKNKLVSSLDVFRRIFRFFFAPFLSEPLGLAIPTLAASNKIHNWTILSYSFRDFDEVMKMHIFPQFLAQNKIKTVFNFKCKLLYCQNFSKIDWKVFELCKTSSKNSKRMKKVRNSIEFFRLVRFKRQYGVKFRWKIVPNCSF